MSNGIARRLVFSMLRNIKSNLIRWFGPFGIYQCARLMTRSHPRILMYHRFSNYSHDGRLGASQFERQISILKRDFNIIPLSELVKAFKDKSPLTKNSIVITIDDGYLDFYQYAYPILKKYNVPATLYVTSGFVDRLLWLWPDRVTFIIAKTVCDTYSFPFHSEASQRIYNPSIEKPYGDLWNDVVQYCLSVSDIEKNIFLEKFANDLGVFVPSVPIDDYSAVTWDQLREMNDNGIDIGAHSITHPAMSKVATENLYIEIADCKTRIESELGHDVSNFCYPNGQPADYNSSVISAVKNAGFKSATVAYVDNNPFCSLFELRRHSVGDGMFHFYKVIYGVEALGRKLLK